MIETNLNDYVFGLSRPDYSESTLSDGDVLCDLEFFYAFMSRAREMSLV